MNPQTALSYLEEIFTNSDTAVRSFASRKSIGSITFLLRYHLPLLLLFPMATALSPAGWLTGKNFNWLSAFIAPPFLVFGVLIIAATYDKIIEHRQPPPLFDENNFNPKNLASFNHLPISGVGIFFLFHHTIGYLMVIVALFYSIFLSIRSQSILRQLAPATAMAYYLSTFIFFLLPLLVVMIIFNIRQTLKIVLDNGLL